MAKGYFETWSDDHMRSFGDTLLDAAETAAANVGGWRVRNVRLGRRVIAFRSTDDRVHSMLGRTMGHLRTDDPADTTISVCDTETTGVPRPVEPSWATETWRHESPATVLYQDRDRDSVAWSDAERAVALMWIPAEASIPPWERPAPLRSLIDRLLGPTGATLVHGGIVGDERGGVMLAGRGGSGKSTSVVACVAAGLQSGGDDFLLMHNDDRHPTTGWSMYATARLLPESPAWSRFHASAHAIEEPRALADSDGNVIKRTVFLNEQFPGSVRDRFPIRAVAVPVVTDRVTTVAVAMRPSEALRAVAPSSMLHLDPRQSALTTIAALVGDVPCYWLQVGSDLDSVSRVVDELLDVEGASG
ncbi:MAG: hypothetical protein JWN99_2229 [Ilumatobacteraceae bacterium]|nr:hypothetical protein [Ilumatobacteraceae bacterium]